MSFRLITAACLFAALVSRPAEAQQGTLRGPWLGGGLGTASARVNCEVCATDRNGGLSGYLAGGIALAPQVRAGAELGGWFDNTNDVSQRLMLFGASVFWNPLPGNGWYLKGGLGLLRYHAATNDPDDDPLDASTAALQVGGGYDLKAGSKLWFSPFANLIVSTSGNLTSGNTVLTDASFSMLQLGAGLTWR
ncbi:MAG: outer membrane beta-barrel protein [Gemmatimonadales bacterium]